MNDHELLSKAEVMRQYKYPEYQLDKDLASKAIPHFMSGYDFQVSDTKTVFIGGRYYIPRYGVEKRIRELSEGKDGKP